MNTAIAAIEEDIDGAAQRGLSDAERMGVSHEEFRSTRRRRDGDRVGGRRYAGRLDRGGNVGGARSDRPGDEDGRHLGHERAACLDGVAAMAAGA
jgi:hypothetical protein